MCSGICVDADALHNITGTYKHSFVAENNPNAVHYLRDNFHIDRYYLDATSEDFADTAPCTSIFVSGFPCQPFSNMGTNKGLADSRGQVIVHVLRHIRTRLPRIAVLENVPGLRFRHPQVLVWILEELNAIRDESGEPAYSVFWNILDALDYGLPQRRQRLFIVSILRLGRASVPFSWPTPVPCLPLHHIYDKDARPLASYDAYPLPPACQGTAHRHVKSVLLKILQYASATGTDACTNDVIIDTGGVSESFQIGHTPTLTRTRASSNAFWSLRMGRPLRISELFRLQGLNPSTKVVNIRNAAMGACLGNAFPLALIEHVLRSAMFAAEHSEA